MKINPIMNVQNFKGGKVIVRYDCRNSQKHELNPNDIETSDEDRNKRYTLDSSLYLPKICVNDRKQGYYDPIAIGMIYGVNKLDAQLLIQFLKNAPGENNILDLTYDKPILKLENEDKAYFVKPRDSVDESTCQVVERGAEAIGWHYDS